MDRSTLPSIDALLKQVPDLSHALAKEEARKLVAEVRAGKAAPTSWEQALRERIAAALAPGLVRVINATGVILHTNLGRAPLSQGAAEAAFRLGQGYCNLELNLKTGKRGERLEPLARLAAELCGAEAALAVNNNAAGVLLALTALAAGKEVVVSRGELVEIGGAFRVPEVVAAGGARLVEVGTTNRTRARDYIDATTPDTAAWLRVHPSNFRVVGFTEAPERAELVSAAKERGVPVFEDLGAGALVEGLGEPTVSEVLRAGVELLCFSGDKLLGGPQAGLVLGKEVHLAKMRRHPLYRALRLDRLVLAALEATLLEYRAGKLPPAVQMLQASGPELKSRADRLAARLKGVGAAVIKGEGVAGGGSVPGKALLSWCVALPGGDTLAARLRSGQPGVVARLEEGRLLLDLRTVLPEEEEFLVQAVLHAGS
jgi:L-seryl-tRNA(Ser) seleniumtransferase